MTIRSASKGNKLTRGKVVTSGRVKRNFVRVITNFDAGVLQRLDSAATSSGLNRSAFIVSAVAERLRQLERDS